MLPLLLADAAPPAVSTTEGLITAVIAVLVPIMVKIMRDWLKDNADRHLATVQAATRLAFWLTEEAKKLWPAKVPNALLFAEGEFLRVLQAQNITPTPVELVLARATWGASHGETKVAAELANVAKTTVNIPPRVPLSQLPPL